MDHMICFCCLSVCNYEKKINRAGLRMLTSGKHALHEVIDITEDHSEALWSALLPNQRLHLDTLQYGLRYSGIRILIRIEYCTEV